MSKLYPREARSLLLESLQDSHCVVRESAIDEIDELNLVEAIPVLRPLLNDSSIEVRQAAETAIKNLASYIES
ncbi:MAG: HEAT repeat domain-containing protein [Xenococcaceae cyanobacterium]